MLNAYIMRRLLYTLPILLGVTLVTFLLFNVVGGDPALQLAGKNATHEQLAEIRKQIGTDQPLYRQYLSYCQQIISFDFGRSLATRQRVSEMIYQGIGPSLSLTLPAFILSLVIGIGLALLSAFYHGQFLDKFFISLCLALMSISLLVYILAYQYFFAYHLGLFPISGWDPSWTGRWQYLALPWLIAVSASLGSNILIYRAAILDETFQDYVRTARAKGLPSTIVFSRHVLRNAMIPIITIVVIQVPYLILGSLLLESFFGIPGLGGLLITAINEADLPVIKAVTVFGSILFMIFNLLSDILYMLVDPRVQMR